MKPNQIPNFRVEDFPGSDQPMLNKIFVQLNPFVQDISQILTQNIEYVSNIKAVTQSYDIRAFQPFNISWPFLGVDPAAVQVVKALKGTGTLTATTLLAPWTFDSSTRLIRIAAMQEITSSGVSELSGRYQFTIRATV